MLVYSSDGISWETTNSLNSFNFKKINNISFSNNKWYIVGKDISNSIIIESVNGINDWHQIQTTNFFDINCIKLLFDNNNNNDNDNDNDNQKLDHCGSNYIVNNWLSIGDNSNNNNNIKVSNNVVNWSNVIDDISSSNIINFYETNKNISNLVITYTDIIKFNNLIISLANISYEPTEQDQKKEESRSYITYSYDYNKNIYISKNITERHQNNKINKIIDTTWDYTTITPARMICQPKSIFTTPPAGSMATRKSRISHVARNSAKGNSRYSGTSTRSTNQPNIFGISTRPFN
jgi:hypothetical protein